MASGTSLNDQQHIVRNDDPAVELQLRSVQQLQRRTATVIVGWERTTENEAQAMN